MSIWGPGILSNDFASDLKDQWKELLGEGWEASELSKAFIKSAKDEGIFKERHEEYEFWICMSLIQWKTGRLQESVKKKALEMLTIENIEYFEGLTEWEKSDYKKRLYNLEKLKATLNSAQPPARKIKKSYCQNSDLEKGDIITIQLKSGKYIGLEIIDIDERNKNKVPIAILYNYCSKKHPDLENIITSEIILFKDPVFGFSKSNFELASIKKKQDEPIERIIFLKRNREPSMIKHLPRGLCFWDEIDENLEKWIDIFNEKGYV